MKAILFSLKVRSIADMEFIKFGPPNNRSFKHVPLTEARASWQILVFCPFSTTWIGRYHLGLLFLFSFGKTKIHPLIRVCFKVCNGKKTNTGISIFSMLKKVSHHFLMFEKHEPFLDVWKTWAEKNVILYGPFKSDSLKYVFLKPFPQSSFFFKQFSNLFP